MTERNLAQTSDRPRETSGTMAGNACTTISSPATGCRWCQIDTSISIPSTTRATDWCSGRLRSSWGGSADRRVFFNAHGLRIKVATIATAHSMLARIGPEKSGNQLLTSQTRSDLSLSNLSHRMIPRSLCLMNWMISMISSVCGNSFCIASTAWRVLYFER
jgi:hypothetical protein